MKKPNSNQRQAILGNIDPKKIALSTCDCGCDCST
jgi:hypothetical protein